MTKNNDTISKMKKSELINQALKQAPVMKEKDVYKALLNFVNKSFGKYFWLNSRDLNYNMIFNREGVTDTQIVDHIIGYLQDSSFCQPAEDLKDKKPDDEVNVTMVDMMNIKFIDDTVPSELGIYIDETYFKLVNNDWIVEPIKEFIQKAKGVK